MVMGVKVDRVKSLVLGRARKLRAEEIERLQAAYGLAREWLVSGNGSALARHANAQPTAAVPPPGAQAHEAGRGRPYLPPTSATDALLLQQVVDATSAALTARGIRLSPQRRLRLYWAVFELSIAGGEVNHAAIAPLLALAESAG